MSDSRSLHLLCRITNCLQTILDLEPQVERLEEGHSLLKEFGLLKSFLLQIDRIDIEETDVERIETATKSFLEELRVPLTLLENEQEKRRVLQ